MQEDIFNLNLFPPIQLSFYFSVEKFVLQK